MKQAIFILLTIFGISKANAQSCFPVGTAWSGSFSGFSGWGVWQMSAKEDVFINGTLCQAVAYRDSSWNQMGPKSEMTIYYHNDGEFLYKVQESNGSKHVLYRQLHLPGDTVLIPQIWQGFGLTISGEVLDTFSVNLIDSSWFAYSIEWACALGAEVFYDTITVIPGFGWWPLFSVDTPLGYMPNCGLFDGRHYLLSCAYFPGLGLYGSSPSCQNLVDLNIPFHKDTPITIHPNPAYGSIQIGGLPDIGPMRIQILDMWGRIVKEAADLPFDLTISLDGIPAGIYQLLIWDSQALLLWTGQFVKVE